MKPGQRQVGTKGDISCGRMIRAILWNALFGLAYLLLARGGLYLAFPGSNASPLWPPSGFALALVIIRGPSAWPAIFLGAFSANLWNLAGDLNTSIPISAGIASITAIGNTLEALCGRWLLGRFIADPLRSFDSARDTLLFLLSAIAGAFVGAGIGPATLCGFGVAPWYVYLILFLTWWAGDFLGILIVAPLILIWYSKSYYRKGIPTGTRRWVETIIALALIIGISLFIFGGTSKNELFSSLSFLLLPLLLLVSYRLGRRGLLTALAAMTVVIVLCTINGRGPFAMPVLNTSLMLVQGFIGSISLTMLVLTARSVEMEKLNAELFITTDMLRKSSDHTENLIATAENIILTLDLDGRVSLFNNAAEQVTGYSQMEILGRDWFDLCIPPELRPDVRDEFQRLLNGGQPVEYENDILNKQGERRFIRWQNNPIRQNGRVTGILASGQDITERKTIEKALRESEAKLQALFASLTAGIFVLDATGRFISCNRKWAEMLGYTIDEMLRLHNTDVVHPDSLPEAHTRLDQLASGSISEYQDERKCIKKDGSIMWGLLSVSRLSGTSDQFMMTVMDITERKNADQELKKSKERIEELYMRDQELRKAHTETLERVSDAFVSLDTNWCYTYMNKKAGEIFNRDPAAMIGKHIWTEFPEGVGQPFHLAYEKAMAEQQFTFLEEYYPPYDRWFENRIYPSNDGLSIFFHDITLRKKAELALQHNHSLLQAMLDASLDAITVIDRDGVILAGNQVLRERWGLTNGELIGHSTVELLPPEIFDSRMEHVRHAIDTGKNERFEDAYNQRYYEISVAPIPEQEGNIQSVVTYSRDITKRKIAELDLQRSHDILEIKVEERTRELRESNERLQELDRLKSEFLSTMSHELRTPLNSIIGFTGILTKGSSGPVNEEQKKQLDIVARSAKHLLYLINDLLELSRIEAGRLILEIKPFNFVEVINEVAEIIRPLRMEKGLVLKIDLPGKSLPFIGDRTRCFQILLNLSNNAVKFTKQGEIIIKAELIDHRLNVSVSDTGIGIKNENIGMLFTAFRQLDGSAKRVYEGTGLGLYLCKKLVEMMSGSISVQSEYGAGSTFSFSLPVASK
ncbi:MAG TPA: PAS domain S-box protein [Spirochaetota bacterium]|nr:PAS domain S-box protein [Spirochaetota bacterium]HPN12029.1 PAS domain S-box protein [Spirochaetota bacterium]